MPKFRKKPLVIEAFQWHRSMGAIGPVIEWPDASGFYVVTLEGPLSVSEGDWIIRGVKGEFYPCKPDVFAATYEEVNDAD